MKKQFYSLLMFSMVSAVLVRTSLAQTAGWTENPAGITTTPNNVSIGTTAAPAGTLDVRGIYSYFGASGASRLNATGSTNAGIWMRFNGDGNMYLDSDNETRFRINGNLFEAMRLSSIGLHVKSNGVGFISLEGNSGYDVGIGIQNNAAPSLTQWSMRAPSDGRFMIRNDATAHEALVVHANGDVVVNGNIAAKYQDIAEWVSTPAPLLAGTVVVLDQAQHNAVVASSQAYDTRVAGVVSDKPGIVLGEADHQKAKIATLGRVKV